MASLFLLWPNLSLQSLHAWRAWSVGSKDVWEDKLTLQDSEYCGKFSRAIPQLNALLNTAPHNIHSLLPPLLPQQLPQNFTPAQIPTLRKFRLKSPPSFFSLNPTNLFITFTSFSFTTSSLREMNFKLYRSSFGFSASSNRLRCMLQPESRVHWEGSSRAFNPCDPRWRKESITLTTMSTLASLAHVSAQVKKLPSDSTKRSMR